MVIKLKKTLKGIGYFLLMILLLVITVGCFGIRKFNNSFFKERSDHLMYTSQPKPIQFDWVNDTIDNYFETHIAITIPVRIEGLPHQFYVQFDTGVPTTIFYGKDGEIT